jgi:hypothetical protein
MLIFRFFYSMNSRRGRAILNQAKQCESSGTDNRLNRQSITKLLILIFRHLFFPDASASFQYASECKRVDSTKLWNQLEATGKNRPSGTRRLGVNKRRYVLESCADMCWISRLHLPRKGRFFIKGREGGRGEELKGRQPL